MSARTNSPQNAPDVRTETFVHPVLQIDPADVARVGDRTHYRISNTICKPETIQAMVFGNFDARSGLSVTFTRIPNAGASAPHGEFHLDRQGENTVSGSATPMSILEPGALRGACFRKLQEHRTRLQRIGTDAIDIEFTVEGEQLKRLQRRALDLRLPNLGSSRAQRMIIPWATLAPRLFRSATTLSKRMSLTSTGGPTPGPSSVCT